MTGDRTPAAPAAPPKSPQQPDGASRWIRWPGVIAFTVVTVLLAAVWWLLVDGLIECVIERTGTQAVGAKVELAAADLTLISLGLTLTGLQVTDPDAPMTNAVEVSRISFLMDGLNLLRRKIIINDMTVDGVRFGTPRKTSGAIGKQEPGVVQKAARTKFVLPSAQIPDVKEILAKEELQSLKLAESLRADIQAEQDRWKQQMAELPNKAKFDDYKQRLDKVKSSGNGGLGGIVGGAGEAASIQKDISQDIDKITAAKKTFEGNLVQLRKRLDEATKAPEEDLRRIRDKYALSPQGLANMSSALIDGPLGDRIETALRWYAKLQPYLQSSGERKGNAEVVKPLRGNGVDVRFKEQAPLPDFLIRTAKIGLDLAAGLVSGTIRNITPDQPVLGTPTTFEFSGDKLTGVQSLKLNGEINRVDPAKPHDAAALNVRGYRLLNLALSTDDSLPVSVKEAWTDLDLKADLRGEALDADLAATLQSVRITTGTKPDAGAVAKAVAAALSDVKSLHVKADITGTVKQYDVRLSSDLDQVLKQALGKQMQEQVNKFEGQLRTAIAEKVNKPLGDLKSSFGGLTGIGDELNARLQQAGGLTEGGGSPGGLKLPF
ncbi:MAG: TIGR03545 family protein [Nitrospiraceae bacterium]|nr:TIGR03545 family protein [Nitrospiraceae bacterium]